MTLSIPLIRAGSLAPYVKWLEARNRPVGDRLAAASLPGDPVSDPERAIPLRLVFAFMDDAARFEGIPNLGWRVVNEASIGDLGILGQLALTGSTVGHGLERVSRAMPHFCTHEMLTFLDDGHGATIHIAFAIGASQNAFHQVQLYTLALIHRLCLVASPADPMFDEIAMPAHPETGFLHLPRTICRTMRETQDGQMHLHLGREILRLPLPHSADPTPEPAPAGAWDKLRPMAALPQSARILVEAMMADGRVPAESLAAAAGVSLRTLQRHLAAEGMSFEDILEEARHSQAVKAITKGHAPMSEIAESLGFATSSGLTRAVRRWCGRSPRELRRAHQDTPSV